MSASAPAKVYLYCGFTPTSYLC